MLKRVGREGAERRREEEGKVGSGMEGDRDWIAAAARTPPVPVCVCGTCPGRQGREREIEKNHPPEIYYAMPSMQVLPVPVSPKEHVHVCELEWRDLKENKPICLFKNEKHIRPSCLSFLSGICV